MVSAYIEAQPFHGARLRRLFLFAAPVLSLGNNVPQVSYNLRATPIALDNTFGGGVELPGHFELRVVHHGIDWLGRYSGYLGTADLGTLGMYGDYVTLGARWYFGGWGRTAAEAGPHNRWARGYVDFAVAPPHNEPNLGRCASFTAWDGPHAPCADFARYMTGGYLEVQPFQRTPLRRVVLFVQPQLWMGNNIPDVVYSAAATPIALDRSLGLSYVVSRRFEVRLVRHAVDWLGRYGGYLGYPDLGTGGLYGHYFSAGVRCYFGGWGRPDETH